jgi:hypothetical protein
VEVSGLDPDTLIKVGRGVVVGTGAVMGLIKVYREVRKWWRSRNRNLTAY